MIPDPLVTCVMVTGKTNQHEKFDRAAITSFQEQTYSNLELLIINDGDYTLFPNGCPDRIREHKVTYKPGKPRLTLGALRNIGLNEAHGEWLLQWDSDDYSHPNRAKYMMDRRRGNLPAVLLWQIRYNMLANAAISHRGNSSHGIQGTVLHPQTDYRYPELGKHEDTYFLKQFPTRIILDNGHDSCLYVRLFHGRNTWDARHIMQKSVNLTNSWQLAPSQRAYLTSLCKEHYEGILDGNQQVLSNGSS